MQKTIYICDKCNNVIEPDKNSDPLIHIMAEIAVPNSYPSRTRRIGSKGFCPACAKEMKIVVLDSTRCKEQDILNYMPNPEITIEDLIKEIVQREVETRIQ